MIEVEGFVFNELMGFSIQMVVDGEIKNGDVLNIDDKLVLG